MCDEKYFFKIKKLIFILTISKLCREFVEKAISRRQKNKSRAKCLQAKTITPLNLFGIGLIKSEKNKKNYSRTILYYYFFYRLQIVPFEPRS